MNLILLLSTFIVNYVVAFVFWSLFFLLAGPFFFSDLLENGELASQYLLLLPAACVLIPAALSGMGAMQYSIVRANGGKRAEGENLLRLQAVIRDICRRAGLDPTDFHLYTADRKDYNAWAIGGNAITVTEWLLRDFTDEEVEGIVAHEVGHLQNGHTRVSLITYGMGWFGSIIVWVYNIFILLCAFLRWIPVLGLILGLISFFILIQYYVLNFFLQIPLWFLNQFGSRQNEYEADEYACRIGLGRELAEGLLHLENVFRQGKRGWFESLFYDHPDIPKRLQRIQEILAE